MRVANAVIGLITFIASCQTNSNYQSVNLDDQHNHAATTEGEEKAFYEINADQGLIIDAANYKFDIPEELAGKKIQVVQVIIEDNGYETNWQADGKVILDNSTLVQIQGTEKFNGFKSGKTVAIGIGTKQEPEKSGSVALGIVYVALIKVK